MAMFESGNPTLSQKIFDRSLKLESDAQGIMSVRGTMNKFGFLLVMVICAASYTWHLFYTGQRAEMQTLMLVGIFGGLIVGWITAFKANWSPYLAPAYSLLQGLALGGLSAMVNVSMLQKYPGIVIQAVGLTLGVAFAMFLLYNFRIIKATERLKSIVFVGVFGVAIFYTIDIILFYGFNIDLPITSWQNTSWISIGFSLLMIGLASLKLITDFAFIEEGAAMGAPKFMEWYGAFGLNVTIVWLYIEMLKLLSRLGRRN